MGKSSNESVRFHSVNAFSEFLQKFFPARQRPNRGTRRKAQLRCRARKTFKKMRPRSEVSSAPMASDYALWHSFLGARGRLPFVAGKFAASALCPPASSHEIISTTKGADDTGS